VGETLIGMNYLFLRNVQPDESESKAQVTCEGFTTGWEADIDRFRSQIPPLL
jgi:hypothetical protein